MRHVLYGTRALWDAILENIIWVNSVKSQAMLPSDETVGILIRLVLASPFSAPAYYHHDVSLAFQASPASRAML